MVGHNGGPAVACAVCAAWLLVWAHSASAAAVTHGDLMLFGNFDTKDVQFRSQKGALKATFKLGPLGFNTQFGGGVSSNAKFAAVFGAKAPPTKAGFYGAPQIAFMQQGARPKVLGVRALPGIKTTAHDGCIGLDSATALRATAIGNGATDLTVYQYVRCYVNDDSTKVPDEIRQWSATVTKSGQLSAIHTGPRVQFTSHLEILAARLSILSNGRLYMSATLGKHVSVDLTKGDSVHVYELLTKKSGGKLSASLKPAWSTKVLGDGQVFELVPTSSTAGFATGDGPSPQKMYYAAKGQATLAGGIPSASYYASLDAKGSTAYVIYQPGPVSKPPATWYVGKVTTAD